MSGVAISVLLVAGTRRTYVQSALKSVLQQTLDQGEFEVIILSDTEVHSGLADLGGSGRAEVRWVRTKSQPLGEILAAGFREARGEVVALLDDDDMWLPTKLMKVFEVFTSEPKLGYFHHKATLVDEAGTPVHPFRRKRGGIFGSSQGEITIQTKVSRDIRKAVGGLELGFNLSCTSVRMSAVRRSIPYLTEVLGADDSFLFYAGLASDCTVKLSQESLTLYRLHESNLSGSGLSKPKTIDRLADATRRQSQGLDIAYRMASELRAPWCLDLIARDRAFVNLLHIIQTDSALSESLFESFKRLLMSRRVGGLEANTIVLFLSILHTLSPRGSRAIYLGLRN